MTGVPIATKEYPAPLDAFETAKPDEPIFTLQGGDPLAAPLVRLWAYLARVRADVITPNDLASRLNELKDGAQNQSVGHDKREQENLLVRATAAEEVSWAMDAYVRGGGATDRPSEAADTHLDELARIDLHDLKVRGVSTVNNAIFEIRELREALRQKGYDNISLLDGMETVVSDLTHIREAIEPRRLFRKDR